MTDVPVPGVRGLDHTADIGLEIQARDLPELFVRGALGTMWLVLERSVEPSTREGAAEGEARSLELVEEDLPMLLRSWLRQLLFWEETEGFVTVDATLKFVPAPLCRSPDGQACSLRGEVRGVMDEGSRAREIKGVTFHGLRVDLGGRRIIKKKTLEV